MQQVFVPFCRPKITKIDENLTLAERSGPAMKGQIA